MLKHGPVLRLEIDESNAHAHPRHAVADLGVGFDGDVFDFELQPHRRARRKRGHRVNERAGRTYIVEPCAKAINARAMALHLADITDALRFPSLFAASHHSPTSEG